MKHSPTPEQLLNIEAICGTSSNLLISAVAGGAKTSTLVMAAEEMDKRGLSAPSLALAFNKRNQQDLEKKLPAWMICKTFNSIGHSAWGRTSGKKLSLNTKKVGELATAELQGKPFGERWLDIVQLVESAKVHLIIPSSYKASKTFGYVESEEKWEEAFDHIDVEPNDDVLFFARKILQASIQTAYAGSIDFADQIYMSVCFGGSFSKFKLVLVDEAQDLSEANFRMVELSRASSGRIIAVGDRRQGIYAFRGAKSESMDELKEKFSMSETNLNTTFRCSKAVVSEAQRWAPTMVATSWAKQGQVRHLNDQEWTVADVPHKCAILCRNNAPLMAMAFKLIRNGRGVQFLGGDMSKGLNKLLTTFGEDDTPKELALDTLHLWKSNEIIKAEARGADAIVARIEDKFECMMAALKESSTIGEAKRWITRIFSEENGQIILCTGHKSKGFEWDHVIFLDSWRIPSRYARKAREEGNNSPWTQEMNLKYVIQTRAILNLDYRVLEKFR